MISCSSNFSQKSIMPAYIPHLLFIKTVSVFFFFFPYSFLEIIISPTSCNLMGRENIFLTGSERKPSAEAKLSYLDI